MQRDVAMQNLCWRRFDTDTGRGCLYRVSYIKSMLFSFNRDYNSDLTGRSAQISNKQCCATGRSRSDRLSHFGKKWLR